MYHSGIGGGGFAVLRDANGEYEAIDFREAAPAAAFEDMYKNNVSASVRGGLAVGVPSEVKGLEYMHTKYGVLPWKTVMQGAIHVARNGFRGKSALSLYHDFIQVEIAVEGFRTSDKQRSFKRPYSVHGQYFQSRWRDFSYQGSQLGYGLCP